MSRIGEWLAWKLNQFFPPLAVHRDLENAKLSIEANREWAYKEAERISFAFGAYWDLKNKDVLDIGGGFGGKSEYFLASGLSSLFEVDIDFQSMRISKQNIPQDRLSGCDYSRIEHTVTDAANLPFPNDTSDAVIAINVLEHITNIEQALKETYRVTRPDGIVFVHLPPYYSPWGPHLENWCSPAPGIATSAAAATWAR